MSKAPKISTKYDELDESYEGPSNSQQNLEPIRRQPRTTRNPNPISNESNTSEHDADSDHDSGDDSFNSANNSITNSSSISENSSTNTSPTPSTLKLSKSHQSAMTLTKDQIEQMIQTQVQQRIQEYATNNPRIVPHTDHAPRVMNVPQLTMSNYTDWAKKIRAALKLHHLWIDPSILPSTYDENQNQISKKAVQFIIMYLDASNNVHITPENEECFFTVWNNLKNFHKPNTSMALCEFYCSIQQLIHRSGECVRMHLMNIELQFSRLTENVEAVDKLSENHKVAIVLASIRNSPEFSTLFHSAKWLKMEALTLSNVKDTIISAQDQQKI